jgi:hypothetical protein
MVKGLREFVGVSRRSRRTTLMRGIDNDNGQTRDAKRSLTA